MLSSLTWAMMGTQVPPTPVLVLGAWVTGPEVYSSALSRNVRRAELSAAQFPCPGPRPSPLSLATGWGWGAQESRGAHHFQRFRMGSGHPAPWEASGASPLICRNSRDHPQA